MRKADAAEPYGERLYAELMKLSGFDAIARKLNHETIEQLTRADCKSTLELFQGSDEAVLRMMETGEPADVAKFIAEYPTRHGQDAGFFVLQTMVIS